MNVSDVNDKGSFAVTPGWESMRFARELVPGGKYVSYVRMIPTDEDKSVFLGDVYVLQEGVVVGMVGGIKFRQYPRLLLGRFFSPPEGGSLESKSVTGAGKVVEKETVVVVDKKEEVVVDKKEVVVVVPQAQAPAAVDSDSTAAKAMALVAAEAGLELEDLQDDVSFPNLGVDSLMSLVIAEKFRDQLGVTVSGSLFLEYPTVGDLRAWLMEYYS